MQVEYDTSMQCFKIQKEPYGPKTIANYSNTFDSFEVVDDKELVVYAHGSIAARFDADGRQQF